VLWLCLLLLAALTFSASPARAATNDLTTALQRGLFEEEANQNLGAAILAYQSVAGQFDKDRRLAATAIFRLGECYRKQGNTNDAATYYERVLREFSDQPTLVTLSRQNLAGMGSAPKSITTNARPDPAREQQRRLLEEEIILVQKQLEAQQKRVAIGQATQSDLLTTEREILQLKQKVAALDAGMPAPFTVGATTTSADGTAYMKTAARQYTVVPGDTLSRIAGANGVSTEALMAANPGLDSARLRVGQVLQIPSGPESSTGSSDAPAISDAASAVQAATYRAARQEQKRLLEEEIKLVQKQLMESQQKQLQVGAVNPEAAWPAEREILKLKRQIAALDGGMPVSAAPTDATANAAAAAEAEVLALQNQVAALNALPYAECRMAIQQNYPNPVLTSLMQKLAEAEQSVATLRKQYGPQNVEVQTAEALVEIVNQQIEKQVKATLMGLVLKQQAAKKVAETLTALASTARPAGKEATSNATLAPSSDADEVKRIQALIKDSPDLINAPDQKGETLLQAAAAKGKLAIVKVLLDSGAAVDGLQQPGLTPLHYAAANGHKAVVDLLLSKGAKADAQTEGGVMPLHLAARKGYVEVSKALLAAGAPINAKGAGAFSIEDLQYSINSSQTPLHLAATGGYTSLMDLLLAKGADVDAEDSYGRTPLSYAVEKHYEPVVQRLLAAHANPNAGRINLPLATAVYFGDLPDLKLLLANGADPNTNTMFGWSYGRRGSTSSGDGTVTPLFLAVSQKRPAAVEELIRGNADPNGTGPAPAKNPVLYEALSDAPTLKALLEGGADPNVREREGRPMLLLSVLDNNQPAVELLLAHHADVNCTNKEGFTPLSTAAANGFKAIAELLLKAGADVNAKDRNGGTPLYGAILNARFELAALLLANKADPNSKNTGGWTALHVAVNNNRYELAELLLANKADPNERNNYGQTPLDIVKSTSTRGLTASMRTSLADLLRQHGASDDLPRMDCIVARRPSAKYWSTVFTKGTNNWNEFTLLELLGVKYDLLSAPPPAFLPRPESGGTIYNFGMYSSSFPFPDMAHLHIRRPAPDMKTWQEQVVDFTPLLLSGDCAKDLHLEWGDVVEIPETDHPLNGRWDFFSKEQMANLQRCLTRQVEILINGQGKKLTLAPTTPRTDFCLKSVLLGSNLVLASSDLSHVKVTRRDAASGQECQWVVDCAEASPAPDFWLRDGDKIEVPALASEPSTTATAGVVSVAPQIPDLGAGWGERKLVFAIDPIEQPAEFVNGFASQNPTNREAMVQTVRKTLATNGSVGMAEFWYTRSEGHLELVISRYPDQHLLDKHWNELTPKFDPKAVAPRVGDSAAWLSTPGRQFVFVFRQGLYTGWVECKTELSGQLQQPLMQLAKVAAAKMAQTAESGASPDAAPPHR
jgi:ankyrin repeat protein/LysM repeat protein